MRHVHVRAEALVSRLRRIDPKNSMWGAVSFAVIVAAATLMGAYLDGLTLETLSRAPSLLFDYQMPLILPAALTLVGVSLGVRFAEIFTRCSEADFLAAYEDETAPRRLRRYAARRLHELASERGADAWAAMWEARCSKI